MQTGSQATVSNWTLHRRESCARWSARSSNGTFLPPGQCCCERRKSPNASCCAPGGRGRCHDFSYKNREIDCRTESKIKRCISGSTAWSSLSRRARRSEAPARADRTGTEGGVTMSAESATTHKLAACMDDNKALRARLARMEAAMKAAGRPPITVETALHCLVENRITLADIPEDIDHLDLLDIVTALNGIIPDLKVIRGSTRRRRARGRARSPKSPRRPASCPVRQRGARSVNGARSCGSHRAAVANAAAPEGLT